MKSAWAVPAFIAFAGAASAAVLFVNGETGTASVILVFFLLYAALNSSLVFPRSVSAAEAHRRAADDGRPVVFWRPGCMYCQRLRLRLGRRARRLHWVNIWRDPAAAAEVRAANGGNETVPTLVVDGKPHTNPDPAWVRELLGRARGALGTH